MKKIKIYNTVTQQWQDISAGQTGPQGPQGIQGVQGPAGADGKGILSANFNADNTLTLTFTDNTTYTTPSLKGATGATGEAGAAGSDGITPIVTITSISGGSNIDFNYGTGDSRNTNVNVYNGTSGTDGHTPVITATKENGVTTVYSDGVAVATINDGAEGAPGTPGTNGTNGADGDDGITPIVTVTSITGGHNVAFSYGTGDARNTNFDVMDGEAGSGGGGSYTAGTGIDITNGVISLALEQAEGVEI